MYLQSNNSVYSKFFFICMTHLLLPRAGRSRVKMLHALLSSTAIPTSSHMKPQLGFVFTQVFKILIVSGSLTQGCEIFLDKTFVGLERLSKNKRIIKFCQSKRMTLSALQKNELQNIQNMYLKPLGRRFNGSMMIKAFPS